NKGVVTLGGNVRTIWRALSRVSLGTSWRPGTSSGVFFNVSVQKDSSFTRSGFSASRLNLSTHPRYEKGHGSSTGSFPVLIAVQTAMRSGTRIRQDTPSTTA